MGVDCVKAAAGYLDDNIFIKINNNLIGSPVNCLDGSGKYDKGSLSAADFK